MSPMPARCSAATASADDILEERIWFIPSQMLNWLWITYETRGNIEGLNRKKTPCFFGSIHCPVVCYKDGKIQQIAGKNNELFNGLNDQLPTFVKDADNRLWIFTRSTSPSVKDHRTRTWKWNIRASRLESDGWAEPVEIFNGIPSGRGERAAVAIAGKNNFWLVWQNDNWPKGLHQVNEAKGESGLYTRELYMATLSVPPASEAKPSFKLNPAIVIKEHNSKVGRRHISRRKIKVGDEEYTLLFGNLHTPPLSSPF